MPNKEQDSSEKRAKPFHATRKQHVNEAAEDYTELVADLIEKNGEARTCEVAKHLGITHVTALRTIKRLQSEGFLKTSPHKPIELTKRGGELAQYCKHRHNVVFDFFLKIGVPSEVAEADVEGVEHHISPETLKVMETFLVKG